MKRLYYFLLLVGVLGATSCSKDDSGADLGTYGINGAYGALNANGQKAGYVSKLLTPPGFERGVGYCYATGADYLEGVTFNIFNLNYLDSIQYVKGLNLVSDEYTPYSEEQIITGETRNYHRRDTQCRIQAVGTVSQRRCKLHCRRYQGDG